jgi:hypothetical protein
MYFNDVQKGSFNPTTGAYTALSDRRFKKNIESSHAVLKKLMGLNVVEYQFKDQMNDKIYLGLIAQDVEPIFPHLVSHCESNESIENEPDVYTLDYSGLGTIAIKAIQEQQLQIETLQNKVNELLKQVEELKSK